MKLKIAIITILIACPFQSNGMLKFVQDKYAKLQYASLAGLYGIVGWSTYNFIKDQSSLTKRKLYAQDFPALGVQYLKDTQYDETDADDADVTVQETAQSDLYQKNQNSMDELLKRHARALAYGYIAPLYVAHINKSIGYGAFADREIAEGELIGEYTGKVYNRYHIKDKKSATYGWALPNLLILDGYKSGNELRFVNHSDTPNVSTEYLPIENRWRMVYVAQKSIAKDEQLLVDYGPGYWSAHEKADENTLQKFKFRKVKDKMQTWLERYV